MESMRKPTRSHSTGKHKVQGSWHPLANCNKTGHNVPRPSGGRLRPSQAQRHMAASSCSLRPSEAGARSSLITQLITRAVLS